MTKTAWILILDDDPQMGRAVARAMSPLGEPRVATSCAGARELLADPSGLVAAVLDLELPDGLGIEVVDELRKKDLHLPILMLSGTHERDVVNQAQERGAEFAYKPFGPENLRSFVDRAARARVTNAIRRWVGVAP